VISVVSDNAPPMPLRSASLDGWAIGVCFDELLDPNSATAADSYTVLYNNNPVPVQNAVLQADGRFVQLILASRITGTFSVTVNNVADLIGNFMLTPVTLPGAVLGFTGIDAGATGQAGAHFACDIENIEVAGGGADVWSNSDQFHLVYAKRSGDFDARVRVTSLRGSNAMTKAVLIARETTNTGSRGLHLSVNPPFPGRDQIEPGQRTVTDGATAAWGELYSGRCAECVAAAAPRWRPFLRLPQFNGWTGCCSARPCRCCHRP
jgi:hypothetical protein